MVTKTEGNQINIPKRKVRRVRLNLEEGKADKLRTHAAATGHTQSEIVELLLDLIQEPA